MIKTFRDHLRGLRRQRWNTEYEQGKWDYLHSLDELGHNSILAGYARHVGARSVLDVGCGCGHLLRLLENVESYVGLDISHAAIAKCQSLIGTQSQYTFIEADLDAFTPATAFDLVVFNESLYYSKHPYETLKAYRSCLATNGNLAVSMYDNARAPRIWEALDALYETRDQTRVTLKKKSWTCRLMSPLQTSRI